MGSTIKVRGQAIVPAKPDEVELGLTISAVRNTREEALDDVTQRSSALDDVLAEFKTAGLRATTTGVSVENETKYENERYRHVGYRATTQLKVRLTDSGMVGRLMMQATSAARAEISGPMWRISLENPARPLACKAAAKVAKARANAYAEALGLRLGMVASVRESELESESWSLEGPQIITTASMEAPEISVRADELDVTAEVDIEFNLEQP